MVKSHSEKEEDILAKYGLKVSQKHDNLIRSAMQDPIIAKDFFEEHLPDHIKKDIDLSNLKFQDGTFIEEHLSKKVTDLLFKVPGTNRQTYLYILVEAQSKTDRFMSFRIFNYINRIWQRHRIQYPKDKYLPTIYPLLLYNGKAKYNAPRSILELCSEPEKVKDLLCKDMHILDVGEIPDVEFIKHSKAGILEYFLKHIRDNNMGRVWEVAEELFRSFTFDSEEQKERYILAFLVYTIYNIKPKEHDQVLKSISNFLGNKGEKLMNSLGEKWEKKGRSLGLKEGLQKGIKEGLQKGIKEGLNLGIRKGLDQGMQEGSKRRNIEIAKTMLKKKHDVVIISEITGLSIEEIRKL